MGLTDGMRISYTAAVSSNPVSNSSRSSSTPLKLDFSGRVSHFEKEMTQAPVSPEFNVRHTIHAIIHPFSGNQLQDRNMDLYKGIISEVAGNQNSFLYYIASYPDIGDVHKPDRGRGYDFSEEIELQNILHQQPDEVFQRIALLTDETGDNNWYVKGYRPTSITTIARSLYPHKYSLYWFAQNRVKTYYNTELTKAYTDISLLGENQRLEIKARSESELLAEGDKTFLQVSLNPQVAKLVRHLGARDDSQEIEGKLVLKVDDEKTRSTNIIASGEYLEACVFGEAIRLALLMGVPLGNISLNTEQPYLSEAEKERAYFRYSPIKALYPPQYYYRESVGPGFLK